MKRAVLNNFTIHQIEIVMKFWKMMSFSLALPLLSFANGNKSISNINTNSESGTLNSIVDRAQQLNRSDIHIYPQPIAGQKLFLQSLDYYSLSLSDIEGNLLLQKSFTNYLDLKSIKAGIYILDIKDSNGKKIEKIVTIKGQ